VSEPAMHFAMILTQVPEETSSWYPLLQESHFAKSAQQVRQFDA